MKVNGVLELLEKFQPVTLEQMASVRLMNRTDTKYLTTAGDLYTLLSQMQPYYYVQEISGSRMSKYETVYLDTQESAMYLAHQNGHQPRKKIRIRHYIDTHQTFLEIKNKNNKGRTLKERILLPVADAATSPQTALFIREKAEFQMQELSPCLESRFQRITLVNKEMTERLTIDVRLQFHNLRTSNRQQMEDLVIIELKQEKSADSIAKKLLCDLHIRSRGLSKYCLGAILTNPTLKQNRFKSKLIQINKLTNQQHGIIR